MSKDKAMKKNNFMQGAFIATIGIVVTKIIGIIYVIPFYALIGEQGGALYGYAYNIYTIFLGVSEAGIPLAISKLVSEYNTLGYVKTKERAFKIGKRMANVLGIISFLVLFFFAPTIAKLIIGDISGGNTLNDITLVVRVISIAVLIVPILSIYKGYLQGHKFITPTSISQVIEQLVRVLLIIFGSYLLLRVFNVSLTNTVSFACFAATVGALVALLYLFIKTKKNKNTLIPKCDYLEEEKNITTKDIIKKIAIYALPFIMIDIFKPLYTSIDSFTLIKTLVNNFSYSAVDAESIMGYISTWGSKFNMIVIAVGTGIMTSLIPTLTSSFVKNDMNTVRAKINKTFQMVLCVSLPMTIGICLLAKPICTVFYGSSVYGPKVVALYIFVALITSIFTLTITIVQVLKDYLMVFISLISGVLFKLCTNVLFMNLFGKIGLLPYYGAITCTILGFLISTIILIIFLKKKYEVSFKDTNKQLVKILIAVLLMTTVLLLMKEFIPIYTIGRIKNIFLIMIYGFVGVLIYGVVTYKLGVLKYVFDKKNKAND